MIYGVIPRPGPIIGRLWNYYSSRTP